MGAAMKTPILSVILSAALALGCAGQKSAARGVAVEGPGVRTSAGKPGEEKKPAEEGPRISPRAKLLFEDALKAHEAQKRGKNIDYAGLERKFQAAAEADSNFGEADYNMGVLAEHRGDKAAARQHYREALRKKPTLRQAAENLAVMAQNEGDEQGAVAVFQDILEKYPDDASSRARLAEILLRRGEAERAIELAKEALFRDPKTLTAYKVMMRAYYEQKQLSMAKLVALRATKLDENDPEIHHTLGLISLAENEPAKARLQFKTAVEKRPDYLPAQLILAKMALKQEDYLGAEESIRRILQANGSSAEAHLNLGIAYKGQGQYDKAMQEYDVAQKLNSSLPQVYLNKGCILAIKGEPEKAIDHFKQYVSLGGMGDHVQSLIGAQEAVIQKREEEKRALEEAKRMEEEAKRQEQEAKRQEEAGKAEEKRQKEEELRRSQQEAKGKAVAEAAKDADLGECLASAKDEAAKGACRKASAPKKEVPPAPKPEEKKVVPASKKGTGEPEDDL